jgi:hypothetical protein
MIEDELNPREFGLLIGQMWAEHLPTESDDKRHLAEVLDERRVPDEVRERVMLPDIRERLDGSAEANADAAFWDGFVDGVRAFQDEFPD